MATQTQPVEGIKVIGVPAGIRNGYLYLSIFVAPELFPFPVGSTATLADFPDFVNWPNTLVSGSTGRGVIFNITLAQGDLGSLSFEVQPGQNFGSSGPSVNAPPAPPLRPDVWNVLFPSTTPVVAPYAQGTAYNTSGREDRAARAVAALMSGQTQFLSYPTQQINDFLTGQYASLPTDSYPTMEQVNSVYSDLTTTLVGVAAQDRLAQLAKARVTPGAGGRSPYFTDLTKVSTAEAVLLGQEFHNIAPTGAASGFLGGQPEEFHSLISFIGEHGTLQRALGLVFDVTVPLSYLSGLYIKDKINLEVSNMTVTVTINTLAVTSTRAGATPDTFNPQPGPGPVYSKLVASPVSPTTACVISTTGYVTDSGAVVSEAIFDPFADPDTYATGNAVLETRHLKAGDSSVMNHFTLDLDGALLQLIGFVTALQTASSTALPTSLGELDLCSGLIPSDATTAPPALRTAGLSLAIQNRAPIYIDGVTRTQYLQDAYDPRGPVYPPDEQLVAADFIRGFVLDVFVASRTSSNATVGTWYSTHGRSITYSFPNRGQRELVGLFNPDDEASLQSPPVVGYSSTDPAQTAATAGEIVLRFNGWSSAVPRPGLPIQDEDSQATGDNPFAGLMEIDISVPTSSPLPRLRYGWTYRLRSRVVDICCNAVPFDDAAQIAPGEVRVSDPITYGRMDPIQSPGVYELSTVNAGESLMRMVIRDIDAGATAIRLIAPAVGTVQQAELHGMLDTAGSTASAQGATTVNGASLTGVTYPNGKLDANAYTELVGPNQYGDSRNAGSFPPRVGIDPNYPVPYLPDPLSRGATLTMTDGPFGQNDYPGTLPNSLSVPFCATNHAWPNYATYLIQLESAGILGTGARGASINTAGRFIQFKLVQGDTVTLALSSLFALSDFAEFGLAPYLPANQQATTAAGNYWAVTPSTTLELIHTTQRPLHVPSLLNLLATREIGASYSLLGGEADYGPRTTGKLDFYATWIEPVDDPSAGAPQGPGASLSGQLAVSNVHVFSGPATFGEAGCVTGATDTLTGFSSWGIESSQVGDTFAGGRHEFHDTKHREVTYRMVATTRYAEYYPELANTPDQLTLGGPESAAVNIPSSARPAALVVAYVVPIYDWGGSLSNTSDLTSTRSPTGLRVFIERPWWSSGDGELLGVITSKIAEQPAPGPGGTPQVVEAKASDAVVAEKAFERAAKKAAERHEHASHHQAAALHHSEARRHTEAHHHSEAHRHSPAAHHKKAHHEERPETQGFNPVPIGAPENHYVTDWGADPVFESGSLPSHHPRVATFTNRVSLPPSTGPFVFQDAQGNTATSQPSDGQDLLIEEADIAVNVAGHAVQFDATRNLWYADIAIDVGPAYTPMIRLALARFQPNSVDTMELGRITLTDVMTIDPGRTVGVIRQSDHTFTVYMYGYSYQNVADQIDSHGNPNPPPSEPQMVPGPAQLLFEKADPTNHDPTTTWMPQGSPINMNAVSFADGSALWVASSIPIPPDVDTAQYRFYLSQYEVIPTDIRNNPQAKVDATKPGYRLAYQDMIIVTKAKG